MKIEIELQRIDRTLAGLVRAMGDSDFAAILTTETISFTSENPSDWFSEKRKEEFESKFNEKLGNDNISYKILSVKKVQ